MAGSVLDGLSARTDTLVVEVLANNPIDQSPEISVIFPSQEISHTSSSTIRLEANASDPDGTVQSVQYYINGERYGNPIFFDKSYSEHIYPYGINWSPGEKGIYTIHAVATDNDGNEIVSDFRMANVATGGRLVPTVIIQDLNEQYLPGQPVFLLANVSDLSVGSKDVGIVEEVVFYANGFIVDTLPEYPYFTRWTPEDNGVYEVYAIARDNEGNFGISRVQTVEVLANNPIDQSPEISVIFLLRDFPYIFIDKAGSQCERSGRYGTKCAILHQWREVWESYKSRDESYSEHIYPYGINWSPGEKGIYTIHAVATDNDGNEIVSDFRMANVATRANSFQQSLFRT